MVPNVQRGQEPRVIGGACFYNGGHLVCGFLPGPDVVQRRGRQVMLLEKWSQYVVDIRSGKTIRYITTGGTLCESRVVWSLAEGLGDNRLRDAAILNERLTSTFRLCFNVPPVGTS